MPDPIRVLLVDDHALTRRGLAAVFSIEDDIVVVGEAATADEAVSEPRRWFPTSSSWTFGCRAARRGSMPAPRSRTACRAHRSSC